MKHEYSRIVGRIPAAVLVGSLAITTACSAEKDSNETRDKQSSKSTNGVEFRCDAARYFLSDVEGDYLTIRTSKPDGSSVDPDGAVVDVLDSPFKERVQLSNGRSPLRLPRTAIQVTVTAIVGNEKRSCPTILYPFAD